MEDLHHTYKSLHMEHHAWRKDLISIKNDLSGLSDRLRKSIGVVNPDNYELLIGKLKKQFDACEQRLSNITQADKLMNLTKDHNEVVSQKLFSINSKMREDLIAFSGEITSLKQRVNLVLNT